MKPLILALAAATALVGTGLAHAQTPRPAAAAAILPCGAKVRAEGLSNADILAIAGAEAGGPVQEIAKTPLRPQIAAKSSGPQTSACREDYSVARGASEAQQCIVTSVRDPADKTGRHMLRAWTCDPSEVDLRIY